MDDFGTLARAHTMLTAVQQEFLKRLLVLFPFLADLAHARVRLYLQTKDRKAFVIAAQECEEVTHLRCPRCPLPRGAASPAPSR